MVSCCHGDRVERDWKARIVASVLSRAGTDIATGGAEATATLLAEFGWKERTWGNQSSQIRKRLSCCDEEGRDPLPAEEGDVLEFIGYLSLDGGVSAASAP